MTIGKRQKNRERQILEFEKRLERKKVIVGKESMWSNKGGRKFSFLGLLTLLFSLRFLLSQCRLFARLRLRGQCSAPVSFVDGIQWNTLIGPTIYLINTNRMFVFNDKKYRSSSAIPQLTSPKNESLYLNQEEAAWISECRLFLFLFGRWYDRLIMGHLFVLYIQHRCLPSALFLAVYWSHSPCNSMDVVSLWLAFLYPTFLVFTWWACPITWIGHRSFLWVALSPVYWPARQHPLHKSMFV